MSIKRFMAGMAVADFGRLGVGFIVWASIIAARSIYTHPYEVLWVVGNVASGAAAFVAGRVWTLTAPAREARREAYRDGRL